MTHGAAAEYSVRPIGTMRTCFSEKFGAPRQSGMVPSARGVLKLDPDPDYRTALNHLESFSHVWILFMFHKNLEKGWRPTVSPPRFQGPRRVGVFASRSPHRPNGIGLSVVKLERIDFEASGGIEIHVSGVDILDQTPILDIKPYLAFADSVPEASVGWTPEDTPKYPVEFSPQAIEKIKLRHEAYPELQKLITEILERDPRPTSQRKGIPLLAVESEGQGFAFRIFDFDLTWEIRRQGLYVVDLSPLADPRSSRED